MFFPADVAAECILRLRKYVHWYKDQLQPALPQEFSAQIWASSSRPNRQCHLQQAAQLELRVVVATEHRHF